MTHSNTSQSDTYYFHPIANAVCLEYGMLILRPPASFVAYVLAGGPFHHFDRSVR